MEEEGEEEEVIKKKVVKKPKLKPKPKLKSTDSADGTEKTTKKPTVTKKKVASSTDEDEVKTQTEDVKENPDESKDTGVSPSKKTEVDEDSEDTNSKVNKSVSFSPSTKVLGTKGDTEKTESVEAVLVKKNKTANPESDKKSIVALTTVFLNTPTESTNEAEGKEEGAKSDQSPDNKESAAATNLDMETTITSPEETKEEAVGKSEKRLGAPIMSAMKKMVEAPMNLIKSRKTDSKSPTRKETTDVTSGETKGDQDSPSKPEADEEMQVQTTTEKDKNAESPEYKDDLSTLQQTDESQTTSGKKRMGAPMMSAMKKMVEGPMKLFKTEPRSEETGKSDQLPSSDDLNETSELKTEDTVTGSEDKEETSVKTDKRFGAPMMAGMKKMVEGSMTLIRSKMDSKSPTRKEKKDKTENEMDITSDVAKPEDDSPSQPEADSGMQVESTTGEGKETEPSATEGDSPTQENDGDISANLEPKEKAVGSSTTSSLKRMGGPMISGMKKMVEGPMTLIRNKIESRSPTRKEKKDSKMDSSPDEVKTEPEVGDNMQVDSTTNEDKSAEKDDTSVSPLSAEKVREEEATNVSPTDEPTDSSTATAGKKRLGAPMMSAMKKMVEAPMKLFKPDQTTERVDKPEETLNDDEANKSSDQKIEDEANALSSDETKGETPVKTEKRFGEMMTGMKKMVEGQMTLIRSKIDSKSPTRKEKKEKADITSEEVKMDVDTSTHPETHDEMQSEPSTAKDTEDSPIYPLPPKNAEVISPTLPPKDESTNTLKKRLGAPMVSGMKKMVEGPMNLIKSKMESKSPTRKGKTEKGAKEGPPEKRSKDDTGSPPLPPRNVGFSGSPILSSKTTARESPHLPLRNKSFPVLTCKFGNSEVDLRLQSYFSDDPKRFLSLQTKKVVGTNGRIRESSLPPPDRLGVRDKSPKVPPKTWMWEELRRTKVKGGYPWTHLYKGSFDEAKWKEIMEHEYEYVDPRPELLRPEPVRAQAGGRLSPRSSPRGSPRVTPEPEKPKVQRRFIRIRDTDQVIIPLHGSSDEEHNPDRYEDPELIGQEEIGLTPPKFQPTPSPSPSRRKASPEPKLSEKLRTTAGNLGSKIRKISIPDKAKLRLPDKPKFLSEIPQIKLPETPKFLTEKPKFLTEKPKFLTERPKFLTEKPKFLTEKPKFLTEKPKFLTEKPKFLTEKPKFLTEKPKFLTEKPKFLTERPKFLTERPKFLTERPKFLKEGLKFPDTSKFKFPERAKINMPSIKLPKARRSRPKKETSVKSEFGSEKNIFHTIKARTYPRFLNKRKRQGTKKATPPPGQAKFDSESLPSTPRSKRDEKWADVYKKKRTDEDVKVTSYTNGESFHERYSKREAKRASSSSMADSDREQVSSGSSTQRHRAGVIEEIDSDEFFVRVKGISREDVQVSRYLSSEIREAFRSPKNALASLDKEDFDDEEPLPPHRSKKPKEYPRKEFNTFPLRPSRAKKDNGTMEKPPRRFRSKAKPGSLPSLHRNQELEMDIEEPIPLTKTPPMPPKRRKSAKDLEPDEHWTTVEAQIVPDEGMAQDEMKVDYDVPPIAPVRKTRSRGTSLADEDRTSRGAESIRSEMQIDDELNDDFNMEDEQRDKDVKEPMEVKTRIQVTEINIAVEKNIMQESPYSNVSKTRPPRPPPPPEKETMSKTLPRLKSKIMGHRHMQQLQSWKNQGVNFFFTYPRKAMRSIKVPKRPVRNYSTISGPTRPPRRNKVFREPVYVDADIEPVDSIPYIDDDEKLKLSQSEEAIAGMKGRPLPPPPRPPLPGDVDFDDRKEIMTTEERNILNTLEREEEMFDEEIMPAEEIISKHEIVTEKMQSRPLPPPPRRKRGSSSSDRKRGSTPVETSALNDFNGNEEDDEEAIDARMTIDISEPITVLSVQQAEPSRLEIESELQPTPVETMEETMDVPHRKITAEISQQTSLEIAEINVSVQTDPLPEGVIVEDTEDVTSKLRPLDSDEEPTIEKYLEKYGSEIKMLGRHVIPSKKPTTEEVIRTEDEVLENIEKEVIPRKLNEAESERNINKAETKVIEKSMPVEKEKPVEKSVVEPAIERGVERSEPPRPADVPISFPDRLHLTHLEVDNLNVSSLKASQILVSDLTGQSLQVTELTSKGGNLVVSGMEFPPSFIQNLASEISAKVEEKIPQRPPEPVQVIQVVQPQTEKPVEVQQISVTETAPRPESPHRPQKLTMVTAPPTVVVQTSAESVSQPTPEAGVLSASDNIPTPRTTRNKGKKTSESIRIVDDSEDELATTMDTTPKLSPLKTPTAKQTTPSTSKATPSTSKAGPSTSQVPALSQQKIGASGLTARQLLIELLKIWKNCMSDGFSACANTVGSMFPEGQKRRDAQTAACVLFIIIIGLFALGFGTDNTVHYHHWDYMPPRM